MPVTSVLLAGEIQALEKERRAILDKLARTEGALSFARYLLGKAGEPAKPEPEPEVRDGLHD